MSKVNMRFLFGLYLFLTQMQLSLHRTKWSEFVTYANQNFSLEEVLECLRSHFSTRSEPTDSLIKKPNIHLIQRWFIRKGYLYKVEQIYIDLCLSRLVECVNGDHVPAKESILNLRLHMAYAADLIQPRIAQFDELYQPIEHSNQNETFDDKANSLKQILHANWPWPHY